MASIGVMSERCLRRIHMRSSVWHVKFTWGKADTATGYRVYQYDASKKAYVKKVSTTALNAKIEGLKAGTEYKFAVQAYYKDSKGNVTFAKKQQEITVNTRPEAVKTLTLVKGSESFDRITLSWTTVSGVTGYEISCVPAKGDTVIKTVTGATTKQCVVDNLTFGTEYTVKIRAYTKRDSGTAYSYNSNTVTAVTVAMPATADEAFSSFIEAYNATKKYGASAALYKYTDVLNFSGENADAYQAVTANAFKEMSDIYLFEKGLDKNGKTVGDYITPLAAELALTKEQLTADSLSYRGNGSGYEITFSVPTENAAAIASLIDTPAIEGAVKDFSLISCTYKNVRVTAKVQSGYISHMEISQDVEVSFKIGLRAYSFTQTVNTVYAFIEI